MLREVKAALEGGNPATLKGLQSRVTTLLEDLK